MSTSFCLLETGLDHILQKLQIPANSILKIEWIGSRGGAKTFYMCAKHLNVNEKIKKYIFSTVLLLLLFFIKTKNLTLVIFATLFDDVLIFVDN